MTLYEVWKNEGENVLRFAGKAEARSPEAAGEYVIRQLGTDEAVNGNYSVVAASNRTKMTVSIEPSVAVNITSSRTPRPRRAQAEKVPATA